MKKTLITLTLIFTISSIYAQVGGLSASKLGTLCTETVPAQTIEFEPFFGFTSSAYSFDGNGEMQSLFLTQDSSEVFSSTGFRFTYGLMDNMEIGVSLPLNADALSIGIKYKLPLDGDLTFGLLAGYNTLAGNRLFVKNNPIHGLNSSIVGGLILSYEFTEKFSADFNAQYHKHIQVTSDGFDNGVSVCSDFGYYLVEDINFIVGLNYFHNNNIEAENSSSLFTVNTGIAIEKAENFILVLNVPIDLAGTNEYQSKGFGLALTIILD